MKHFGLINVEAEMTRLGKDSQLPEELRTDKEQNIRSGKVRPFTSRPGC